MRLALISLFAAIAILGLAAADCGDLPAAEPASTSQTPTLSDKVDGYIALAPAVLRAGQTESISVSLFDGQDPAKGEVSLALLQRTSMLAESKAYIEGSGMVELQVPDVTPGDYELRIKGQDFVEKASLHIESRNPVLLLETDNSIYKPGQDILIRVLQLSPELKPMPGAITVEIQDAKGNKIFREESMSDDFGMIDFKMPISPEPNLGIWRVTAASGDETTQIDVTVDKYSLPKYEIAVDFLKSWILADEPIAGTVSAEYSFGRPVKGELEIVASRYVGKWEEFATYTTDIDGEGSFELPAVGHVAGVSASGGQGNLALDVTVRENSTGYIEHTSRLLTVAESPLNLRVIPEGRTFKPQLPFTLLVVTETPDHQPLDRSIRVWVRYFDDYLNLTTHDIIETTTKDGRSLLRITPPSDAVAMTLHTEAGESMRGGLNTQATKAIAIRSSHSPSNNFIYVKQSDVGMLETGGQARFEVSSTGKAGSFHYEVIARGKVVLSGVSHSPDIVFGVTPIMAPSSRLVVYQILPDGEVAADYIPFDVAARFPMAMDVAFSSSEARPGEAVDINVTTHGPSKVGLAAVDRSAFIRSKSRLNLHQVFGELERLYTQPQFELLLGHVHSEVRTVGAEETFREAGLVVLSSMDIPQGQELPVRRR